MRILRHQIAITDYQEIELLGKGQLLSVAVSRTIPEHGIDLWSLDYQSSPRPYMQPRAVYVIGTGNPMPDELLDHDEWSGYPKLPQRRFIGTVVTPNGFVWHVFEGPRR